MDARAEILERFFPGPRTEPTFGIVVELEARDLDGNCRESVRHTLDDLAECPGDWMVAAYAAAATAVFEAALPAGRWVALRELSVTRNMSDAERWAF